MASPHTFTHAPCHGCRGSLCRVCGTHCKPALLRGFLPRSSLASPGKMGALPADGMALLQREGALGSQLRMELSAEHQALYKLMVWAAYLCPLSQWSFTTYPLPLFHSQTHPFCDDTSFVQVLSWVYRNKYMHSASSGHTEHRAPSAGSGLRSRWCPRSRLPKAVLPHFPHTDKGCHKHAILVALTTALFLSLAEVSICTVREAILLISYRFLNFPPRLKNSFRELETVSAA